MSTGEVLDAALRMYQRLGLTFLRLTAVPALLCLAAAGFVQNYVLPDLFLTKTAGGPSQLFEDVGASVFAGVFVGGPLFLLGLSYSSAIVVNLVSADMLGKAPDPEAATQAARSMLARLFLVNLRELGLSLSGVIAAIALMTFGGYLQTVTPDSESVPGIIAAIGVICLFGGGFLFLYIVACDALATPIAILEDARPRAASNAKPLSP